jgi:hypothetical protein
LTEEELRDISVWIEQSLRKSLKKLYQQAGASYISARNATKLLRLRSYKITEAQALSPRDPGRRVNYSNWFIQPMNDGILDLQ